MNATDLVKMLTNPEFLQREENKSLEKLIQKHPYFFIAHALLAKKNSSDQKHSTQFLNGAVLSTGDREMLFHFMKEKFPVEKPYEKAKEDVVPFKPKRLTAAEMDNSELMEMLKSIHERKTAFLNSGVLKQPEKANEVGGKEEAEIETSGEFELSEVSIADSEFSMHNILIEEESADNAEESSSEIESMHELDSVMSEQAEFDLQEDFLLTNEISGAGAEFIPTDFLNSEDANEEFAMEPDSEIQSMGVFEEEFIFSEPDHAEARPDDWSNVASSDKSEVEIISVLETPLQVESESTARLDLEDISEEEIIATEFLEDEISEQLSEMEVTEVQSVQPPDVKDSELRINEQVTSPGEFLPDKSYTYSQWLHFFKYDPAEKKNKVADTKEKKEEPKVQEASRSFGATMQLELEAIDRVVSSIRIKTEKSSKEIFAEELAKKSLVLNEEIVSETLAKIYDEQGSYDKAIRQYVKLSLIYPEKVSFFATRIKELKGKK